MLLATLGVVVRALDFQLKILGLLPAAAILSATLVKSFTHITSVTKQYCLVHISRG